MDVPSDRIGAGILAFKHELIFNEAPGYVKINAETKVFGKATRVATIAFQKLEQIGADGVIGPTTALHLFRKRAAEAEVAHGIPNHYLCKQKTLESANDPVAQGYLDPYDEGLAQISLLFHPNLTLEQAWDPAFALDFEAKLLASDHSYTGSWRGALAAYNIGRVYAKQWVASGYQTSGGPIIGTDPQGRPIDAFVRATNYTVVVEKSAC